MLHRLPAGALAFEQAEAPAFVQFLVSGSLKLLGVRDQTEAVIEIAQPFDLGLPAAAITGQPYLLRGQVFEEAQLVLVAAEPFRAALANDNALCRAVLGFVASQLRRQLRAAKSFRLRSRRRARRRLSARSHCGRFRARGSNAGGGQERNRSQLGMTRETFSRTLSSLSALAFARTADASHRRRCDATRPLSLRSIHRRRRLRDIP